MHTRSLFFVSINFRFILSLSCMISLISFVTHGTLFDLIRLDFIGACLSTMLRNIFFHASHISLVSFVVLSSDQDWCSRSLWNSTILKDHILLVWIIFTVFLLMPFILCIPYTRLWSVIPKCWAPDATILSGSFVIRISNSEEVSVIRVGSLISWLSW